MTTSPIIDLPEPDLLDSEPPVVDTAIDRGPCGTSEALVDLSGDEVTPDDTANRTGSPDQSQATPAIGTPAPYSPESFAHFVEERLAEGYTSRRGRPGPDTRSLGRVVRQHFGMDDALYLRAMAVYRGRRRSAATQVGRRRAHRHAQVGAEGTPQHLLA